MDLEPDEIDFHAFRTDRPGIRKVLGDLEAEIMELVWNRPPDEVTTVRDVFEILYERRRIAYTTVMNTMARLGRKKLLRVEKHDQAYLYFPALTQQEFIARFVSHILEDLFVSFSGETLESLDTLPISQTKEQLHTLLYELSQRRKKEEGD